MGAITVADVPGFATGQTSATAAAGSSGLPEDAVPGKVWRYDLMVVCRPCFARSCFTVMECVLLPLVRRRRVRDAVKTLYHSKSQDVQSGNQCYDQQPAQPQAAAQAGPDARQFCVFCQENLHADPKLQSGSPDPGITF